MTAQATTVDAIAINPGTPGTLHRTSIEVPSPGLEEVAIEVIRVGVCGTDRELIRGEIGSPPEGSADPVLGHEVLGRVTTTGDGVSGLAPGDLVTVTVRRPDDCAACQAGEPDMCITHHYTERGIFGANGFMTSQIVENQRWVIPVPAHLEPIGVLTEPLTVVEKAVRHARLIQQRMTWWQPQTALVMGAGPIGLLGTLLLRSQGVDVYTLARTPGPTPNSAIVEACGAHYVSTQEQALEDLVRTLPNIDLIIESSGSGQVVAQAMRLVGNNGIVALLSLVGGHTEMPIDIASLNTSLVAGNKVVFGSVNAGMEDFTNAVASLDRFESLWPGLTETMITHRFTPEADLDEATSNLPGGIKSVIEFGG